MYVELLVRVKVEPREPGPICHSPTIVAECVRMAAADALCVAEENGFVHNLHNEISLHVETVAIGNNS